MRANLTTTLLASLAIAAAGCGGTPDAAARVVAKPDSVTTLTPEKTAGISVQQAGTRSERLLARLSAQLVPDESRTVRITSPVSGRILTLDAAPGTTVQEGAPLAHIASSDLAQARSDVEKASAVSAQMEAALTRARDLYAHHINARKDIEQAEADAAQARAESARAHARVTMLGGPGRAHGEYVLTSPIAGEVVERTANPGMEVRPDLSAPLFVISDLRRLWLTANVSQHDLSAVRPGARLVFRTDAVPDRAFEAHVTFVGSALDPQSRTALVRATLVNRDRALRTMETGEASLYAPESTPTVVVPSRALVTRGEQTVVFIEVAPRRYIRRKVVVGDDDGSMAAIRSGLAASERVVVDGSLLLAAEAEKGP